MGELVGGFFPITPENVPTLAQLLRSYAQAIFPWAQVTAGKMLAEVNDRNRASWNALGQRLSAQLHRDITNAPVGEMLRALLGEQVVLIQSIPTEAAQRVHDLTIKGLEDSTRAAEIAHEIGRTEEVTRSRATLIARTEVSRTSTNLTQARCAQIGATHYRWRTAGDGSVRPGHRAMEGKLCEWASPPSVEENGKIMHFHPGTIWNCRCYAEPVLDLD